MSKPIQMVVNCDECKNNTFKCLSINIELTGEKVNTFDLECSKCKSGTILHLRDKIKESLEIYRLYSNGQLIKFKKRKTKRS